METLQIVKSLTFAIFTFLLISEQIYPVFSRSVVNKDDGASAPINDLPASDSTLSVATFGDTKSPPGGKLMNVLSRSRRSVLNVDCTLPNDLMAQVLQLNSFLNDSQYLGMLPTATEAVEEEELLSCPSNPTDDWWPVPKDSVSSYGIDDKDRFRSTCPWKWGPVHSLNANEYPRNIKQATCVCRECVNSGVNKCEKIFRPLTLFRVVGCNDFGEAILETFEKRISVGCQCVRPVPANGSSGSGLPPGVSEIN